MSFDYTLKNGSCVTKNYGIRLAMQIGFPEEFIKDAYAITMDVSFFQVAGPALTGYKSQQSQV
jgi:hypothetical protein